MSKAVDPVDYRNEESHDRLMAAFQEYFRENQEWQLRGTKAAGERVRYCLAQIRIIARERRVHVQQYRTWLNQEKKRTRTVQKKPSEDSTSNN